MTVSRKATSAKYGIYKRLRLGRKRALEAWEKGEELVDHRRGDGSLNKEIFSWRLGGISLEGRSGGGGKRGGRERKEKEGPSGAPFAKHQVWARMRKRYESGGGGGVTSRRKERVNVVLSCLFGKSAVEK